MTDPGPRIWIVGLGVIAVLLFYWLETARAGWATRDAAPLKAAAVILGLSLIFGVIHELRIYMPVVTCVLLAGIPASGRA